MLLRMEDKSSRSSIFLKGEKRMAKAVAVKHKPKKRYSLLFMVLPFMLIVLLFNYVPIFGWIYSVFDYIPGVPLVD